MLLLIPVFEIGSETGFLKQSLAVLTHCFLLTNLEKIYIKFKNINKKKILILIKSVFFLTKNLKSLIKIN